MPLNILSGIRCNDYRARDCSISVTPYYTTNVFWPEQDLSFFFFVSNSPRKVSLIGVYDVSFFILIFLIFFFIDNNRYTDIVYCYVYISVVALYITSNSNNTHKSITLPRHNTHLHTHNQQETFLNDAYEVYRYNVSRNLHTHIMLHSSHKQTMNTK